MRAMWEGMAEWIQITSLDSVDASASRYVPYHAGLPKIGQLDT
jgi:hypothetical protein